MLELTLLQLAREFCKRTGLPQPATVAGATDATTQQIWGLLNEGIQDISDRYHYFQQQAFFDFQHQNTPDYGALVLDVDPVKNFKFASDGILWDITNRMRAAGPLTLTRWQQTVMMGSSQAQYSWTLFTNRIHIYPVPTPVSSVTFRFYYQTTSPVYNSVLQSFSDTYVNDTDYAVMPGSLLLADIKWRYKKEKGFPYAEDLRVAEEMLDNFVGRTPQGDLHLEGAPADALPTLYVAAGSTIPP